MMFTIDTQKIAEVVGGKILARGTAALAKGVSTDTRTLKGAPSLFVAIKGPHFDAHTMLAQASAAGAVAMLVEQEVVLPEGAWGIRVDSTVDALGDLARWWRGQFEDLPVVGVAGSNGKSTTKQMIAGALSSMGNVCATEGNFNNLIGLPLTVFRLDATCDAAVLEMGMSAKGEVKRLAEIAGPKVGVVTNVYPEHMEFLQTLEEVAKAEGELFETMRPDGVAIINLEDPWVRAMGEKFPGKKITYGMQNTADIRFGHMVENGLESIDLNFDVLGQRHELHLPVPGAHNVMNAMAATAVAVALNVPVDQALEGIRNFRPMKMRMERVQLANGIQVINDCYNASPDSMQAALRTVAVAKRAGRFIAVLGSMLELGAQSPQMHRDLGKSLPQHHVDQLFTFGDEGREIAEGAKSVGVPHVIWESDMEQLKKTVAEVVKPGDIVLVKGSRGMQMERVIDFLKMEMGV